MSIRYILASLLLVAACGDDGGGGDDPNTPDDAGLPDAEPPVPTFQECDASDQSFVRQAHLALLGSRPKSHSQVQVHADLMTEVRALAFVGGEDLDPYRAVAEIIVEDSEFIERWSEHFTDALRVPRIEDQSQQFCYGDSEREIDGGELATYVRDNAPTSTGDGGAPFTMLDLLRSSIVLDDMSPVYRAHLFALVSKAIPAANVPRVQAELARREDFGNVFDATYLNRDQTCLACHNTESSVTEDVANPELSRHFDVPGHFEKAIYGDSYGIDPNVAHAPFRFDGFVSNDGHRPWGWDRFCGRFETSVGDDVADIDGVFATLSGKRMTTFDLEQALRNGFESIATNGVVVGDDNSIEDKDAAFAYLVASNIVDGVWAEIIGHPLTISNHFPRNAESRDLLQQLTEDFIKNRFSLKQLVIDIVLSDYFNRLAPNQGCGSGPYNMPPVFDPWTTNEEDDLLKPNGPGDGVKALSARTLLRAAHAALEWRRPFFETFPEFPNSTNQCAQVFPSCGQMEAACQNQGSCCYSYKYWCDYGPSQNEPSTASLRALQRGIGVFLKHGDKGFRGLDFQARLVFEDRFGTCRKIDPVDDFLDAVVASAQETPGATLEDVIIATKDRLIGEPYIDDVARGSGTSERDALVQLFGVSLNSTVDQVTELDDSLRSLCVTLLSTPQFLLQGIAPPDASGEPTLTPSTYRYETVCANLVLGESLEGATLQCDANSLSLE